MERRRGGGKEERRRGGSARRERETVCNGERARFGVGGGDGCMAGGDVVSYRVCFRLNLVIREICNMESAVEDCEGWVPRKTL